MTLFVFRLFAALVILLPLAGGALAQSEPDYPTARDYERMLASVQKPPRPGGVSRMQGDDSCRHANDLECDEPGVGTGACDAGTDYSDCWRIMTGQEDNSCQWANDGECDEPRFGTGACTQGTDLTDCGDVSALRFRNDSCATAFNGVCEEPERGNGSCDARTDRADCDGRTRPTTINDHFFGRDDRRLMDVGALPWRVIGYVDFDEGGTCTASLIGPDILVTAAHCISDDGRVNAAGTFHTPGTSSRQARVTDFLLSERWDEAAFNDGEDHDGTDWALLRLDRRLGDELGYIGVKALVRERGYRRAAGARLSQAGYSWDTGDNLSGNLSCRMLEAYRDETMSHDCDTTRGDSGSPFLVNENGEWYVVATDSNFRANPDGPFIYIAARSEAWIDQLAGFASGELGNGGVRPRGPGKPGALKPIKG
ncbi:MAG: trypsin-like serine protease [Pseudomonadota bacterium]